MANNKIITYVELSVNPQFIEEVISNAIQTKDLILLEAGTEMFNLTTKKDEPNTLVIFAKYTSKVLYEWHLEQAYVKSFFVFLEGKLTNKPKMFYLQKL